jgi:hypothetical protein
MNNKYRITSEDSVTPNYSADWFAGGNQDDFDHGKYA